MRPPLSTDLAAQLKRMREVARLTQTTLAARINIDPSHVSKIESGDRTPSMETLQDWAIACGCKFAPAFEAADPVPEPHPLVADLRALREARGMTQAQVAQALGAGTSTVSMWECGTNEPTFANLQKWAAVFGLSLVHGFRPMERAK